MHTAQAFDQVRHGGVGEARDRILLGLGHVELGVGHDQAARVAARAGEERRLGGLVVDLDRNADVALRDHHAGDAHASAGDDGAGPLVDHHPRERIWADGHALDAGDQPVEVAVGGRGVDHHGAGVADPCDAGTNRAIDAAGDALGGGHVRILEDEGQGPAFSHEVGCDGGLHRRSAGHRAGRRVVLLLAVVVAVEPVAADNQRALGEGVWPLVRPHQRRHQQ